MASKADWGTALEREAVIRPLTDQLRLSEVKVQDAAAQLGLALLPLVIPTRFMCHANGLASPAFCDRFKYNVLLLCRILVQ